MKSKDTAGHTIAKGNEREKQRLNDLKYLEVAKDQDAKKNGRFVWNASRKAYFLTLNS